MTRPAQGQTSENNIQADVTKNDRFAVLDGNKSDLKFEIAAASNADDGRSGPTHLVCLCRLVNKGNDIREHLLHIRIMNEDIANVIKLNCKNKKESSFCLSIHGEQAKSSLLKKINDLRALESVCLLLPQEDQQNTTRKITIMIYYHLQEVLIITCQMNDRDYTSHTETTDIHIIMDHQIRVMIKTGTTIMTV